MTATNPHPLANPLNQGRFRNYSYGQASTSQKPALRTVSNPKELTVPDSTPYGDILARQNASSKLTILNQDIPYYNGPIPMAGFLGNSPLMQLSDGTVLDLKKCKVVYDPNTKWKAQGYWNDPNGIVKKTEDKKEWGPTETIESMLNNIGKPTDMNNDPSLSPESIRYWKKAEEESKKMEQNLTDEQKSLLADLQSGKLCTLSRLVEEK